MNINLSMYIWICDIVTFLSRLTHDIYVLCLWVGAAMWAAHESAFEKGVNTLSYAMIDSTIP